MNQETIIKTGIDKKLLPQFIKARNNYFIAKALNDTNLDIDKTSRLEVINENDFKVFVPTRAGNNKYKVLDNINDDCFLTDQEYLRYIKLVHKKRVAKGLKLPYHKYEWAKDEPYNLCCDVETRPLLRLSENALIEQGINILPEPLYSEFKQILPKLKYRVIYREKLLNLMLKLDCGDNPTTEEILKGVC